MRLATLPFVLALLTSFPAFSGEIAGVKVPDSVQAGGKTLKLNGAGIRKKFIIKVYVGALYLESAASDPNAIVSVDQAKSVHMYFLREVDHEKIMGAFREGIDANSPEHAAALKAQLEPVAKALPDLKEGAELVVTYVPGVGTTVGLAGTPGVTVAGKEFGDALFRNWLGTHPADGDLKARMLGEKD